MLYFLAIVFPPLAVFLCGKPITALLNLLLTILTLWVGGIIHACIVVSEYKQDDRNRRLERAILTAGQRPASGLPLPAQAGGGALRVIGFAVLSLVAMFLAVALVITVVGAISGARQPASASIPSAPSATATAIKTASVSASPKPVTISGAELTAAQKRAIAAYPELGRAGSPLNREFLARVKTKPPEFFTRPDWPAELAAECSH